MPTGPALRAGDSSLCPLTDGPKPHGGGPITPVAAVMNVLIGGMPAAVANGLPGGVVCVSPIRPTTKFCPAGVCSSRLSTSRWR